MFIIIWHYTVAVSNRDQFESAYGPNGAWARLFSRAEGYLGTELLCSPDRPGDYATIDHWESRDSFDHFKQNFAAEYAALDHQCDRLTTSETLIGQFDTVD